MLSSRHEIQSRHESREQRLLNLLCDRKLHYNDKWPDHGRGQTRAHKLLLSVACRTGAIFCAFKRVRVPSRVTRAPRSPRASRSPSHSPAKRKTITAVLQAAVSGVFLAEQNPGLAPYIYMHLLRVLVCLLFVSLVSVLVLCDVLWNFTDFIQNITNWSEFSYGLLVRSTVHLQSQWQLVFRLIGGRNVRSLVE